MSGETLFKAYLKHLVVTARQGDAREESFYPVLAEMLKEMANSTGRPHVHVTTLPKTTEGGNPDFRLWNGSDRIIGYIEAKKPNERLDVIETSKQLERYRSTFPNLILTNFLEFRLYRNGKQEQAVMTTRSVDLNKLRKPPPIEKPDELYALLNRFLDFALPKTFTAESLAVELAKRTRLLRDVVVEQFHQERNTCPGMLSGFFDAFQIYLIGSLKPENFADLFAQTITYGLFAARIRAGNGFNRRVAFDNIPHTIGVLRDLFRFISLGDLPEPLAWCVDDIAEVLAVADALGILERYYRKGQGKDPIVHFYETFLKQYDPDERERRGVYYTPEPVVGYIVRSLHDLLKTEFDKQDGLASDDVTLLDPAAGTMTFLARAAKEAVSEFETKYGSGGREDFIRRHILKNFYALELMMAPYAVGHLKMSFFLEELGHRLDDDERVPFYLTNTLDWEELEQSNLPGFSALAEESRLAGAVKKQTPILCVLGNPPYSGHSSNTGDWIHGLIEDYKHVDGKPLGEKNPKWLQDDYVKFLRFAQWKIEQAKYGVVGMITNHGYLDNPTFRGMRQSLMRTFDDIYILDLHGNTQKKEICPDGSPDKNVFEIRLGVAIAFFVKRGGQKENDALVRHAERFGQRESKYDYLNAYDLGSTEWKKINPVSPSYMFIPRDDVLEAEYRRLISIPDVFPVNSVGIVTARDRLTIHWPAEEAWDTVRTFSKMEPELARQRYQLGNDARDWKVTMAQEDLLDSGPTREKVVPILYRPFDVRHTYYTGRSRGFICRPRPEVMHHMLAGENLALITPKRVEHVGTWQHTFVTDAISEHVAVSLKTIDYHFPLYHYPTADRSDLFSGHETSERQPNLNPELVAALTEAHGGEPSPKEIFHYIYAVLYAPTYREKYAEFLRIEFPRIPFTADRKLFIKLAALGVQLVDLHLLRSPDLDPPICRFDGEGDAVVARTKAQGFRYDPDEQRMCVNKTQYFGPVSPKVYDYQIGGYQVCSKWLKDRKDRRLELDDIRTYCWMVTALDHTLKIQKQIDTLYTNAVENPVSMS